MPSLIARYDALVAAGQLKPDPEQRAAAQRLSQLQSDLEAVPPRGSILWRITQKKPEPTRGVYLWGGVGRGKSMLMDLFVEALKINRKRRVHFHEFMLEVHDRMRRARASDPGDPIPHIVHDLAQEARCLAFDEMVVNNSADAMIMSRLFTGLVDQGVTLVITSNRAPSELYKDGLNREHFLPFIALIETRLDVRGLNGPTDYRLERIGGQPTWYAPLGDAATAAARALFVRLTDYTPEDAFQVQPQDIDVGGGRMLHVPKAFRGVAIFSFARLCRDARGASDYLAIARRFHTVIIMGIPLLGPENRNEAARFVTLIDALYEHNVKLIAAAAAAPEALYPQGDGAFEFQRTVSRLSEMQSADYMARGHGLTRASQEVSRG